MKAKLKLVSVAMLGVVFTAMLLAGISAHAERSGKLQVPASMTKWDGKRPGGL